MQAGGRDSSSIGSRSRLAAAAALDPEAWMTHHPNTLLAGAPIGPSAAVQHSQHGNNIRPLGNNSFLLHKSVLLVINFLKTY